MEKIRFISYSAWGSANWSDNFKFRKDKYYRRKELVEKLSIPALLKLKPSNIDKRSKAKIHLVITIQEV